MSEDERLSADELLRAQPKELLTLRQRLLVILLEHGAELPDAALDEILAVVAEAYE